VLSAREVASLEGAVEELQRLVWLRLEERGALAARGGAPGIEELLRRPLGLGDDHVPGFGKLEGPLGQLVDAYGLDPVETLAVVAALAPEIDEKFDVLYGALVDRARSPGLTTEALRNLVGRSFAARLAVPLLASPGGKLRALRILIADGERVRLNPELAAWLCGRPNDDPEFSHEFPAVRLRTIHGLDDLILAPDVRARLDTLLDRVRTRECVLGEWGFAAHHDNASGLHVLFHGPPGTGKTLAAAVIGAQAGLPVYRIDLSLVVSKYIGETEKNLAQVFERAEARDWILFFDEADALFGRRGEVTDARDRYANQEVSYLLQRLETFSGVTILATNFLRNVDEAFLRRIHLQVPFRAPEGRERGALWRTVLPPGLPLSEDVDLESLAESFDLTGGEIRNAAFHAAYRAAADGGVVTPALLEEGIRGEYEKGGRRFPASP
jgi:ATPase family associated with various cellular activities (AAA)/Winged helix domain, variant